MTTKQSALTGAELNVRPIGDSITVGRWLGCPDPDAEEAALESVQADSRLSIPPPDEPESCGEKEVAGGYRHYLVDYYFETPVRLVGDCDTSSSTKLINDGQQHHDGHTGWKITDLMNIVTDYTDGADIILLHAGTNDLIWGADGETTANRLVGLIEALRDHDPGARFLVAQIIPVYEVPSSSELVQHLINSGHLDDYNSRIPQIIADFQAQGVTCDVVDMWSNMNAEDYLGVDPNTGEEHESDGIHPYVVGYQKMAERWARAIRDIMNS